MMPGDLPCNAPCSCEKGGVCDGCPCLKNSKGVEDCYAKWAQMPYVEKEGGADV